MIASVDWVRITIAFTTAEAAQAVARLAEHRDYMVPCWIRDTLGTSTLAAVQHVSDHRVSVMFDLPDTCSADDALDPADFVFAPPVGVGDFSPLVPPPRHGRRARLLPSARIVRIEQRVFEEKKVSVTRTLTPEAYSNEGLREFAVSNWMGEIKDDMDARGIVAVTNIVVAWFVLRRCDTSADPGWERVDDGTVFVPSDRVFCALTAQAVVPGEAMTVTFEDAEIRDARSA